MTVRQFLNGVREAKAEVLNLQRKLLELKTASENVTAHWKDVPGGGGSADPHKDEIVNALCDLSTMYGEKVLAYLRYMITQQRRPRTSSSCKRFGRSSSIRSRRRSANTITVSSNMSAKKVFL